MDTTTLLYIFVGLSSVLLIAFLLCVKLLGKHSLSPDRAELNVLSSVLDIEQAHVQKLIKDIHNYSSTCLQVNTLQTSTSKLGHDINGALQLLMFNSTRMKKKNTQEDLDPLIVKFDQSVIKIRDLIVENKKNALVVNSKLIEFDLVNLINMICKNYDNAYKLKNNSYKIVNSTDTDSIQLSLGQYDLYVLETILTEAVKDYFIYSPSNLTLPISIDQSTDEKTIQMAYNSLLDVESFESKYQSLKSSLGSSSISIVLDKSINNTLIVKISIAD